MQNPIDYFLNTTNTDSSISLNMLREYLQVMTLKFLYGLDGSEFLRFGGGTCLRICHNLPRFSEDLDFSLDNNHLDTSILIKKLEIEFKNHNLDFEISTPEHIKEKRIQKYWLKFPTLLYKLKISPLKNEKLNIKLEIDKFPAKNGRGEFFYITKFDEYFPIYKNDLPTLFSGKIGAVIERGYHAMRDFYDLIWYLNNNIQVNYEELNEMGIKVKTSKELMDLLEKTVDQINGQDILDKIGPLIENPSEKRAFQNYQTLFRQAKQRYISE